MGLPRILARSVLLAAALARPAAALPPDGPPPAVPAGVEGPTPIFLKTPADRDEFWKMLARPDFVILDGDLYRKLRQGADATGPRPASFPGVVESVAIGGQVDGDWARLAVEIRVALDREGPAWVPIHLDGLTLSEAREGGRDLPARVAEDRSWSVELAGRRDHLVRIQLMAPARSGPFGRRVELAIPPAASTRLGIESRQPVLSASTGPDEPVAVAAVEGRPGASRMEARLGPRPRVELTWREPPAADPKMPPLLSCQGEIAVEVEPGTIRTRGTWLISAIRGSADRLTARLEPAEEVVEVRVDGRSVPFEARREGARPVVAIPLASPVAGAQVVSLEILSRRSFAASGPARVVLQGTAFDEAKVQLGTLAISRTGPVFLNPTPGRALRRIDPRTDLSEGLRGRQDTSLAFEFNDQPFDLQLGIDPAPPRLRIEARTTLAIGPRSARVETRLECRVTQGRPFELRVSVPKGLVFEEAGPPELLAPPQLLADDPADAPAAGADADRPRTLVLSLNRPPKEPESFAIRLRGRAAFDPAGPVAIPLFRPPPESSTGGKVEVVGARDLSVELDEPRGEPSPFRADPGPTPASALASPGDYGPLLALRYDSDPGPLRLRVAVLPRTIRHEATLTATVDRKGAEVVEEIALEVAHGAIADLDLVVPTEVPADWELEGAGRSARELLGREPDGSRRFRVAIARGDATSLRLRARYRKDLPAPATAGRPSTLRLAPIRVVGGISESCLARIVAEPGVDPRASGDGWTALDLPAAPESGPPARVALTRSGEVAGPIEVEVRPVESVALPGLVASRLWLRTTQRADDELATSAHYRLEGRGRSITIGLPPGSRWVRGRVGGLDLAGSDLARVGPDEYRVEIPPGVAPGTILLDFEYVAPASASADGWASPDLRDAAVQQTMWEFHTIGTRAGIGIPRDWTDENEWFWDGLLWRRRPWRTAAELSRWLTGGAPPGRLVGPPEWGDSSGRHSYLFSRPGPPDRLHFPVFSRIWLLLSCSGPVLLAGLLILARRPSPRLSAAAVLLAAFAVGAFLDFDSTVLVAESSTLGVVLLLAAVAMNRVLDRRVVAPTAPPSGRAEPPGSMSISATGEAATAGSDDSTAIRARPSPPAASTADHIVPRRPAARAEGGPLTTDLNLR